MALSNFQRTIVDDAGNVIPNATVTVRVNDSSGALADLFTDRAGTSPASNPISADGEGFVRFYVAGGRYYIKAEGASAEIEWEDYLIGTMQGQDSDDVDITGGDIAGADITGGSINGTTVGATTASTGAFTTASASTSVTTPLITRAGNIELSATGANLLDFKTDGQDRMRITSAGNVLVGTTTDLAGTGQIVSNNGFFSRSFANVRTRMVTEQITFNNTDGTEFIDIVAGHNVGSLPGFAGMLCINATNAGLGSRGRMRAYMVTGFGTQTFNAELLSESISDVTDLLPTFTLSVPSTGIIRVTNTRSGQAALRYHVYYNGIG